MSILAEILLKTDASAPITSNPSCENPYSGEDSLRPSHRPDGHGLGLSILEDLANRYQGEINVEHIQNVFVVTIWLNAQKE